MWKLQNSKSGKQRLKGCHKSKQLSTYNNWLKQQVSLIPAEFFGGNPGQFAEIAFGTKQTYKWYRYQFLKKYLMGRI